MFVGSNNKLSIADSTTKRVGDTFTPTVTIQKIASTWGSGETKTYIAGIGATATAFSGSMNINPVLRVGDIGTGYEWNGTSRFIKVFGTVLTPGQIGAL